MPYKVPHVFNPSICSFVKLSMSIAISKREKHRPMNNYNLNALLHCVLHTCFEDGVKRGILCFVRKYLYTSLEDLLDNVGIFRHLKHLITHLNLLHHQIRCHHHPHLHHLFRSLPEREYCLHMYNQLLLSFLLIYNYARRKYNIIITHIIGRKTSKRVALLDH